MSMENLIDSVTPEIYQSMKLAIETGKWPNGVAITPEQRESCLQVVIAYDALHKDEEERVGFLPKKPKGSASNNAEGSLRNAEGSANQDDDIQPLKILNEGPLN